MSSLGNINKLMKKEGVNAIRGGNPVTCFLKRHPEVAGYLEKFINKFSCFKKASEVLAWLQNDVKIKKCPNCKKRLDYSRSKCSHTVSCGRKECSSSEICRKHRKEATKRTMQSKFGEGITNVFQLDTVKQKIKESNLQRYGVDNPAKSKEIYSRIKETNLKKYGVESVSQHRELREKVNKKIQLDGYEKVSKNLAENSLRFNTTFEDYHGIHQENCKNNIYNLHCDVCGLDFDYKFNCSKNLKYACPRCYPYYRSTAEHELVAFIERYYPVITNDRTVLNGTHNPELDIYVPEKKVAIEFNGLYWHSERQGKDRNYHLDKSKACYNKGIRLIHIFEDEWEMKQKIVKARLRNILGVTPYKIAARKCEVRTIDSRSATKFINKYHIQGSVNASINLGLFYKNRLVAVMTFSKSRFNKNYDYELLRYCTVFNFNIVGGAGKLFKFFTKVYNPGKIISYADRRWSWGNLYKALNFKELRPSMPSYYYVKNNIRYNRIKFQKHKLSKVLSEYSPDLTEAENMYNNGYERVWDCGNLCYAFEKLN